jgi:hypothetical protein
VVVEDLDRQVLPTLPEYILLLLANHFARAVMRIHHTVTHLELDVRKRFDLKVLQVLFY